MKKTLLITYFFPPAIGGIENYYSNLLSYFKPEEIVVLAQTQEGAKVFDQKQPYHIYRADFFGGRLRPTWRGLEKDISAIIRQEKIEQIVFGHFHPLAMLGKNLRLPYFVFVHGSDITQIKNSWWQKATLRRVYKNAQAIIANSQYLSAEVNKITKNNQKIQVVYPGIDFTSLNRLISSQEKQDKMKLLNLESDDIILLSMGRLEPEKQYDLVIKSLPALLDKVSNLKYLIVGDGSAVVGLDELIGQLDLRRVVKLVGPIENTAEAKSWYYQQAHVFITVSRKPEGFGISYLEAQACATPVIASKNGGSAEAVVGGKTGILIEPDSQKELIDALYRLLSDKIMWQTMAEAGQSHARQFDWARRVEEIKNILP